MLRWLSLLHSKNIIRIFDDQALQISLPINNKKSHKIARPVQPQAQSTKSSSDTKNKDKTKPSLPDVQKQFVEPSNSISDTSISTTPKPHNGLDDDKEYQKLRAPSNNIANPVTSSPPTFASTVHNIPSSDVRNNVDISTPTLAECMQALLLLC